MASEPFVLRWGIVGTGLIASWFVSDLVRDPSTHRNEYGVKHIVQAVSSSSSIKKAEIFAGKHLMSQERSPTLYDAYEKLYADPNIDIVYVATPNAMHMKNVLDSISAGKHVLCEKPLAVTAKEAETMIHAAQQKGVFLMEAVWTRFFPLTRHLQSLLHEEKAIGRITRATIDFGLDMPLEKQTAGSRVADLSLGAGSLLDIGLYSITWGSIAFGGIPENRSELTVSSALSLNNGIDEQSTVLLNYRKLKAQAICSASYLYKSEAEFGRIEGTEGSIHLLGKASSKPRALIVKAKGSEPRLFEFDVDGWGFFFEADAVAKDVRDGKKENEIMPHSESLRIMRLLDEVRHQGGMRYPQEDDVYI